MSLWLHPRKAKDIDTVGRYRCGFALMHNLEEGLRVFGDVFVDARGTLT
jgi:hypothetical protein